MKPYQMALLEQFEFLFKEFREEGIDVHEFIRLTTMVYEDFLEFHPDERLDIKDEHS